MNPFANFDLLGEIVGQIVAINFLLGVSRLISGMGDQWSDKIRKSGWTDAHQPAESGLAPAQPRSKSNIEDRIVRRRRFGKCAIYFLLLIAAILIPEGGPLFLQVFRAFVAAGLFCCAIGFFIAGCLPKYGNRRVRLDDGREVATQYVTAVAWFSLTVGETSILLGVDAAFRAPFPLAFGILPLAAIGIYLVIVFIGLRKFRNWARMMALVAAIVTIPWSWYALWVLFGSDAKYLFRGKAPAMVAGAAGLPISSNQRQ
jgi:hypothetical protein